MLRIACVCSGNLRLGFPVFICPISVSNSFCSFSTSFKVISPLCILLKIRLGPLKLIEFFGASFGSLKLYVKLLKPIEGLFFHISVRK